MYIIKSSLKNKGSTSFQAFAAAKIQKKPLQITFNPLKKVKKYIISKDSLFLLL